MASRLHARTRSRTTKIAVGAAVLVVLAGGGTAAGLVLSGSSSTPEAHAAAGGPGAGSGSPTTTAVPSTTVAPPTTPDTALQAKLAHAVVVSPTAGSAGVDLGNQVKVTAGAGTLTSVHVATTGGKVLSGEYNAAKTEWQSTAPMLAGGAEYKVTAAVAGQGVTATTTSSFTTATPSAYVGVDLWPSSGITVGVGQPIVLTFDHDIPASGRTSVLSHLHLALSKRVTVGAWWFSAHELHLRPASYWPSGEQISVSDDLDGWNAGEGIWGEGQGGVRFSVGAARISTANLATHTMTVTENGKEVYTYPISGGSTQFPTMNGTHIVLDRQSVVHMDSATVGIPVNSPEGYNEIVYWDVHISDSGEYVHAAPWSVADQGSINVSHGCINLSTANAQQFFGFSRIGDVVNVVGGPRPPAAGDHGVMDWSLVPFKDWPRVPVSALS